MNEVNNKFDVLFGKAINWSSLVIILVSLSGLMWIITYLTLHEVKPIKNEIIIETKISKKEKDSILEFNEYIKKVDERITELKNVENNLNKKIDEINTFYKFLGTILAIIIAITGFFGFKSLHELKIRNLENAKEVAKNEANNKVEEELENLKDNIKTAIELAKSEAKNQTFSEMYKTRTEVEALSQNIKDIFSRLKEVDNVEENYEDLSLRVTDIENNVLKRNIRELKPQKDISNKRKTKPINDTSIEEKNLTRESFGEEGFDNDEGTKK